MAFQSEVNSNMQALGNAGQIAKGYHSYCNIVDYVAGDNISVGEFAQSSTINDNEVLSTANKTITGSIVGVVVRDSLKNAELNEASLELQAGSYLQVIDKGSVFIETSSKATRGDYVLLDKYLGSVVFSKVAEVTNLINTGWRVANGNEKNVKGIVEITTTRIESNAGAVVSPTAVGDLVLKDGTIVKPAEVTTAMADDALGVIAFIEQGGGRALLADTQAVSGVPICSSDALWWAQGRNMAQNFIYGVTNDGKGPMPTWATDMKPFYRSRTIEKANIDEVNDPIKYPAFAYVESRGDGWMVPTPIALSYIHENKTAINATLTALGKTALAGDFTTTAPFDIFGLYFRNFAENLDNSVPDYTALRERNATDGLFGIADRNLGTAKIIAVKVIGL